MSLFGPALPLAYGRIAPGVENVIVELEPTKDGTFITGSFDKIGDCAFLDLEFYLGTRETGSRVPVDFSPEGAKDRPPGASSFGPWFVPLNARQVEAGEAWVLHRCNRFLIKLTKFY